MKNLKKGFTLIELLIVIALLGALAVGLLAALDPFEQLKKGDDTGIRNTVSELQGAIVRYYAIRSEMPWMTVDQGQTTIGPETVSNLYDTAGIDSVISTGELKADFSALAGAQLNRIRVAGTEQSVTVCFMPASRSFRSDKNTKFDENGVEIADPNTACAAQAASNNFSCYWCVR